MLTDGKAITLAELVESSSQVEETITVPVGPDGAVLNFRRPMNVVEFRGVRAQAEAWAMTAKAKLTTHSKKRDAVGALDNESKAEAYVLAHYIIDDGADTIDDRAYSFCVLAAGNGPLFNAIWTALALSWWYAPSMMVAEAQQEGKDGLPETSGEG